MSPRLGRHFSEGWHFQNCENLIILGVAKFDLA